jgi:hypothetical protein
MQRRIQTAAPGAVALFAVVMVSTSLAAAQSGSALVPPSSRSNANAAPPGPTHAYSIATVPWTSCSIHPEGITNDPSRSETVVARDDGKLRFDIASAATTAWGTRLTVDCVANNTSYFVDLNDSSTFTSESAADLQPVKTGVRPPLTGNLTAISMSQLAQGSYPFRPDVSSSLYSLWVQAVSRSVDIYRAVPVTILGMHNTGAFVSEYKFTDLNWGGVVQSANGFDYPYVNQSPTKYSAYDVYALAPSPQGCWGQSPCDDSSFWAGTGGTYVSQTVYGALMQNGFQFPFGSTLDLFAEFYPGPVNEFQAAHILNPGDLLLIQGYDGDANCNYVQSAPTNGCFAWEDLSQGDWVENDTEAFPAGSPWLPVSAEYISEWHKYNAQNQTGGTNDNVTEEQMFGGAIDTNGAWHYDPGNSQGTDPYEVDVSTDAQNRLCTGVKWENGTINTAVDPMFFTTYQCGPN